jgi:hypothetical protein
LHDSTAGYNTVKMEGNRQFNGGQSQSRVSKALPPPPPPPAAPSDTGIRGKSNPFPTQNRALPAIPRRPVGNQGDNMTVRSMRSASSTTSESPKMVQSFGSIANNGSMDAAEIESVPPPPPKHNNGPPQLPEISKTTNHLYSLSISSTGSNPSSPQSELWRRRSIKIDKSATISDLKLNKSNGSTATPSSTNQPSSPPKSEHSLPSLPSESIPAIVGLPGRNIRKAVPVHEQAAPPNAMGSKPSKISNAGMRVVSDVKDMARIGGKSEASRISPVKRLPTPDYQPTDKPLQQQLSPQLFSPASPVTPSSVTSPGFRRDSLYLGEQPAGPDPPKPRDDRILLPSLRPKERFEKLTATTEDIVLESPQPQKPTTTSNVLAHQPAPSVDIVSSTLPVPASPHGVSSAAPLSVVHLNCYQSHKFMRSSRNDICPVECMVCEMKDKERRWMCNWCSLRCCDPCMKGLVQVPGKDLRKFLESIGKAHRTGEGEGRVASSTYHFSPISPGDEAAILDLYS